jgi:hypothetical protein
MLLVKNAYSAKLLLVNSGDISLLNFINGKSASKVADW